MFIVALLSLPLEVLCQVKVGGEVEGSRIIKHPQ